MWHQPCQRSESAGERRVSLYKSDQQQQLWCSTGAHVRMKQEEQHPGTPQPHDPYAFPPTTPQSATPQDEGFHAPLRLPHSGSDTYPGSNAAMQAGPGLGSRPSSEPGDLFHSLPPAMVETFGPPSASSSAHASPVHSLASTPPRPGQYALSPGQYTLGCGQYTLSPGQYTQPWSVHS